MGNFIEEFITTGPARSAYLKGVELFGFVPVSVSSMGDNPGSQLKISINGAVRKLLSEIDRNVHPERATLIGLIYTGFNDSVLNQELTAVKTKLDSMFDAGADPSREHAPLMVAIEGLCAELGKLIRTMSTAGTRYLENVRATRQQELPQAQNRVEEFQAAVNNGILWFNHAGRDISIAAAAAIEHQAVYFNDPPELTFAMFALADAAERLNRCGGDLPRELQLRESDGDLNAFVKYAASGIAKVPAVGV